MHRRSFRIAAAFATAALFVTACAGDDDGDAAEPAAATGATAGTEPAAATGATAGTGPAAATGATAGTEPAAGSGSTDESTPPSEGDAWAVDTEDCVDPDAAHAPIEGTVHIGGSGALSGGPAATAFAPVIDGIRAYVDYANANDVIPGYEIEYTIGDDKYDASLTPGVISEQLDAGADLISSMVGTPNNLAVRDVLNDECVPHLMAQSGDPAFGDDVAEYPWSTGGILAYNVEWMAYAFDASREFPDGATAALFYANNDAGLAAKEGFEEIAGEYNIDVVVQQTIEGAETAPPVAQLAEIAAEAPDIIAAFPIGAQCPVFLTELTNQRAANPGWEPRVYLTNTCASPLILAAAGEAANGILSSGVLGQVDIMQPQNQTIPEVAAYLEAMDAAGKSATVPTSMAGWVYAEVTVEILRRAAESPEGMTRASIINAARNLDFTPGIAREGVVYRTSGEEDGFLIESVQIIEYDAETTYFNDVGELITQFESS